jgi:DNA-binding transcriptional ArsR family regulator
MWVCKHIFNRMVELQSQMLDAAFRTLSDPTWRVMLRNAEHSELSVGELAAPFDMPLTVASKDIKALEPAGLIHWMVRGRTHVCRNAVAPPAGGFEWLRYYEKFWRNRLDDLERELNRPETEPTKRSES